MRSVVIFSSLLFIGLWLVSVYLLLGYAGPEVFGLTLPGSTSELGDSLGVLNGLLSSIAIVLALLAVLIQSKELKDSTQAQHEQATSLKQQLAHQQAISEAQLKQAEAIVQQLEQQQISNRIVGLSARQRFLLSEMARMDKIIEAEETPEELVINAKKKKSRLKNEAEVIDHEVKTILEGKQTACLAD